MDFGRALSRFLNSKFKILQPGCPNSAAKFRFCISVTMTLGSASSTSILDLTMSAVAEKRTFAAPPALARPDSIN